MTLSAEPLAVSLCHCVNCQKTSGSAFSVIAIVPLGSLQVTGRVSVFKDVGESGIGFERCFCPGCGSPIESRSPALAARGITIVKASLFDDTSWLAPTEQIYCKSAQRWLADGLERLRSWPAMPARPF